MNKRENSDIANNQQINGYTDLKNVYFFSMVNE